MLRKLRRTCFTGAAFALVAAFGPWAAAAQTSSASGSSGSRPRVFTSSASATALEFFPDRNNGFTIPDAARLRFVAGDSATSQSGGPTARSSTVDPGGGATKGPSQICGLAGGPVSENLPQLAFVFDACLNAHWPFTAEADEFQNDVATAGSTEIGQPTGMIYGQGGSADARIDPDSFVSSTDAVLAGLRLNPLPGAGGTGLPAPSLPLPASANPDPSVFDIGAMSASTSNVFDGPTLVSHAESHLSGIHLLGGLVDIDSIVSVAESRSADGQAPVGTSSVTVQGVTVAGQRASIGSDGVELGDSGSSNPNWADSTLNQLLQAAGISIRLIGATQGQTPAGITSATAQGVEIDFAHEVDLKNTPLADLGLTDIYTAKLLLGSAATGDLARNLSASGSLAKPSPVAGSSTGAGPSGSAAGTRAGAPQAAAAAPSAPGEQAAGPATRQTGVLGIDPGRIEFLYLSFTLAALGLCVSPRLTLPARFARAG